MRQRRIRRIATSLIGVAAATGLAVMSGTAMASPMAGLPVAGPPTAAHGESQTVVPGGRGAIDLRPAVTGHIDAANLDAPIPTSQCLEMFGIHCYSPLQFRTAYQLDPLYNRGITGAGRTIVLVDSFGSPTIRNDVNAFDTQWGLPHVNLRIVQAGSIPPFDPNDGQMVTWAEETSLDVEYAHAIAPGAKIVLVETPVAEIEGTSGLPEMMNAEKHLIDQGVGDVISQSFGATENTFPGVDVGDFRSLTSLRFAFQDAQRHHVTVLAATGDEGATNFMGDASTLFPFPVTAWPSTDPLVTAVGGTQLTLNDAGQRTQADVVWNDGFGATGGGTSAVFGRPVFQTGVRSIVGNHRGVPDISVTGALDGGGYVYMSFLDPTSPWNLLGGTSLSTPVFAGIVALADQVAHQRLGNINDALYLLGDQSRRWHNRFPNGLVDVTSGDNSFGGVTGFPARAGFDLSTGWGTIDATTFVPALAIAGSVRR